jgi:hypothetical protein
MPFKSKAQLRLCYYGGIKGFSKEKCDEWLRETPSVDCLPERVGMTKNTKKYCRNLRKGEQIKSKIYTGPRGGKYFLIYDKVGKVIRSVTKVYIRK